MREIKFRGKMIPENEWIYGTLLRIPHPPACMGKEESDKYYIQFADPRYMPDWNMPYRMVQGEVEAETIGQYTGLKDKNDIEIYDGDILDHDGDLWLVEYSLEFGMFTLQWEDIIEDFSNMNAKWFEIIGNTTDNPELLEEV